MKIRLLVFAALLFSAPCLAQQLTVVQPTPPCSALGTSAGTCAQGGQITAGGPTGSATVVPIITYNAAGQLTTVTSATIAPAIGSITGLGTGVSTALGIAVGSAGGPVTNGGALGTPTSGSGANLSSVVNSITGTANQVVASASTGAITLSLPQSVATVSTVQFGSVGVGMVPVNPIDVTLNQNAASQIQILNNNASGSAFSGFDAYNGSDQTQFVTFGTGYTTSGIFRAHGGLLQANGAGGLTLNTSASQPIYVAANSSQVAQFDTSGMIINTIGTDAALADATMCRITSTGRIAIGSGTLGICLGTSSRRFKTGIAPLAPGLTEILRLKPVSYHLDKEHGDPNKQMYGFIAEDMVGVLPKLVGLDNQGRPNTADYLGLVPVLTRALQQQQIQIDNLRGEIAAMERHKK